MALPWWSYLWDCCDGVYGTFCTIPTVESYGGEFFVPTRTLIAAKWPDKSEKKVTCVHDTDMMS